MKKSFPFFISIRNKIVGTNLSMVVWDLGLACQIDMQ